MGWQLGGLSLPGLLPLLSLLLLLVGGDGDTPAGETVSGPGVVEGETDAVVAGVSPVRLQVKSLFLLLSLHRSVLYDRSGMTGQQLRPGYQCWGHVGDEREAATDKYQVRPAAIYQSEFRTYLSIGEEGSEEDRRPSFSLSIIQSKV